MATPIAHKGVIVGAKAIAMTLVDLMTNPELVKEAKAYFTDVQLKKEQYLPMISATDQPPIYLNTNTMANYSVKLKHITTIRRSIILIWISSESATPI